MRKSLKCGVGLAMGAAISLASIQPAVANEPRQVVVEEPGTSEVIDASVQSATALQALGVIPSDFVQVSEADRSYFDDVATLALSAIEVPSAATPATASATCTSSQRTVYASEIAAVNSARDANARSAAQETMYMYLSHYIDLAPSLVGDTCGYNSTDPRFSAWITNADRTAYDRFLATTNLTAAVDDFSDAIQAAMFFKSAPGIIGNLGKTTASATSLIEDANFVASGLSAAEFAQDLVISRQLGHTPEQAIADLEDNLSPDVMGTYGPALIGVASSLVAPMLVAPVLGVGLAVLPVYVMLGATIVNQAAWAGLLYSSNGRVSGRMMRYLGM